MPRQNLYPDDRSVALSVRLPETMYAQIQRRAKTNRRSLNQEVVWLVQRALELRVQAQKTTVK